tara:strand:- start:6944 stop:7459 length:516 start_codon:yes stop_codon:yes gene_type:complete
MKNSLYGCAAAAILFVLATTTGCQPTSNVEATFNANAITAGKVFEDFAAETESFFSHFSADALWSGNAVGSPDTLSLYTVAASYGDAWAKYDYRLVEEPYFLPGVNPDTKKTDGSVRGYFRWEISKAATDSTEALSVEVKLYESFDFNPEGKIRWTQVYGDLGAAYRLLEE